MLFLLSVLAILIALTLVLFTFLTVLHGWLDEEIEFRMVLLNSLLLMAVALSITPQTPFATPS